MHTDTESLMVERELSIAATPETVWEFLVDPEKVTRWMGLSASLEPRPGGVYRVDVMESETARGEFTEVDPPHRLAWTWGFESGGQSGTFAGTTKIEIELESKGGGTRLRFRHSGLASEEALARHTHGWEHYLARLIEAAAGGDPGPDPWARP